LNPQRGKNTNYKTKHVTEFPSEKEENMPIPFSFFEWKEQASAASPSTLKQP